MNSKSGSEQDKEDKNMEMEELASSRGGDERVGYRKPPRRTRFQPGKSGNPSGRPRARETVRTKITELLIKKVPIRFGNKMTKKTQIEVIMLGQLRKAAQGDTKAVQFCMKMAEQFGCLEHMFKGRIMTPRDYLLPEEDLERLSAEELDQLIFLHEKAMGRTPSKPKS